MNVSNKFFTVGSFVSDSAGGLLAPSARTVAAVAAAANDACFVDYSADQCAALSFELGKLRTQAAQWSGLPQERQAAPAPSLAMTAAQPATTAHATVLAALAKLGATPSLATVSLGSTNGSTLARTQAYTPSIM